MQNSIGLDKMQSLLYSHSMKVSVRYKVSVPKQMYGVQKEMVDFARSQFSLLVKKNLGLPMKTFRL